MGDKKRIRRLALVSWGPSPSLRCCISDRLAINSATRCEHMISTYSREFSDSMLGNITGISTSSAPHTHLTQRRATAHVATIEDRQRGAPFST
jgi:hypothetical protein